MGNKPIPPMRACVCVYDGVNIYNTPGCVAACVREHVNLWQVDILVFRFLSDSRTIGT